MPEPESPQNLPLAGGWLPYGYEYAPPTFYKSQSGQVFIEGLVKSQGSPLSLIGTLPPGYRPAGRLIFSVNNHDGTTRVDVLPTGEIYAVIGNRYGWVPLNPISFRAQN